MLTILESLTTQRAIIGFSHQRSGGALPFGWETSAFLQITDDRAEKGEEGDATPFLVTASSRGRFRLRLFGHLCFDVLNLVPDFLSFSFQICHVLAKAHSGRFVLLLVELVKVDLVGLNKVDELLKSVHGVPFWLVSDDDRFSESSGLRTGYRAKKILSPGGRIP